MSAPNVLIVMVDQFQAALLDEHSPVKLPALARLASTSTRLTQAFTPAPICTPARASFQLGRPVYEHGVTGNNMSMPAGPTMGDHFTAAGYATSYVGKWHLDPVTAAEAAAGCRGWQHFSDAHALRDPAVDVGNHVMANIDAPHEGVAPYGVEDHLDGRIAAQGLRELNRLQAQASPFALTVSFYGPHAPYFLPQAWHDLYDPDALALPETFDAPFTGRPPVQQNFRCRAWGKTWSEAKWRRIRAAYFGYVAMIDHLAGQLLEQVDLETTAVLFLADHGENNGHLRMIYKGPMMDDTLVRIPALLHMPGQRQPRVDDRLVDMTDLGATMLGLSGGTHESYHGHDVTDATWPGRPWVISEFHEANWVSPPLKQRVAMIRDKRWKLVATQGSGLSLYDMTAALPDVDDCMSDPAAVAAAAPLRTALASTLPWVASEGD